MSQYNQVSENRSRHEMFETAQKRIKQKKLLFQHFILFVLGSIFMYVINQLLEYGIEYKWYLWGILAWGFIFLLHLINVFVTNRFLGKDWERKQRAKLVEQQERKIAKIRNQQIGTANEFTTKQEITNEKNVTDSTNHVRNSEI